ncbi:DUF3267 domain-containing protein [Pontibacter anaerobius]|uniref:DUF3267 domain-containing protein n=1 Tax=Pontibacter anaerobius TaxID=2993940 RepID=A0ABT3REF4_9BACT|nr:DUF3267 domain-containing protein [Pontibacter anaerobius]MCX2739920.1 DUF3267 domain-containing protein [Pontibacter anaerobius]
MQQAQYKETELTLTAAEANVKALVFMLPLLVLYMVPYMLLWPEQFSYGAVEGFVRNQGVVVLFYPFLMLLVFVLGAVVHELLHGLTWAIFCKRGVKSISYGVHWRYLTPYCHCQEVLPLHAYILGGVMPGLVMGLMPALAGVATGNLLLFLFGLLFSIAASGDLLVLWMLRHAKSSDLVQDHPDKIGCYVYSRI